MSRISSLLLYVNLLMHGISPSPQPSPSGERENLKPRPGDKSPFPFKLLGWYHSLLLENHRENDSL